MANLKSTPVFVILLAAFLFAGCTAQKRIGKKAEQFILSDSSFRSAHTGISIYDAMGKKYLYNYQGDKFFVPASNTKIPTIYAAMRFLGDSLPAAALARDEDGAMLVFPTGDPTFLHPDYKEQPLMARLQNEKIIRWDLSGWRSRHWGNGWSWNDYEATYMAERSPFPVYGNVLHFQLVDGRLKSSPAGLKIYAGTDSATSYDFNTGKVKSARFGLDRSLNDNKFFFRSSSSEFTRASFPFRTDPGFISGLLKDTLQALNVSTFSVAPGVQYNPSKEIIYSQPLDSLLKPLMYRSDNFFAEQTLLMVSHHLFGVMDETLAMDTLLKTDFSDLPQKPRWADGSGLSRYNLFTPQSLIHILDKMKDRFGMERLKGIFATGGSGTLRNYYVADSSFIYAKTGTLSGVVALSGYMITQKNKMLIFSILVNNHCASSTDIRRGVEKFLQQIRRAY